MQKCRRTIRILEYDNVANAQDDYLKMHERTIEEYLYLFFEYVIDHYSEIYLWKPTWSDVEQLYDAHQTKHGFLGMIGSIDCTHLEWKRFPNAWRGQFTRGGYGVSTIILDVVESNDLRF